MNNQNESMSMKSSMLIILLATQCSAQSLIPTEPSYFGETCGTSTGNMTADTTYVGNLKTVLSTLQQQSSTSTFYNSSAGSGAGEVHGQYYCRGDIDSSLCSTCIQQASEVILTNCSNIQTAVIYYDICTLRYHNESMFGLISLVPFAFGSTDLNVSDPATFSLVLNRTVDRLIDESVNRFAVGDAEVSTLDSVYVLVQCSPDLIGSTCELCLRASYGFISSCCGNWPMRMRAFFPSCQIRYSNVLFYNAPVAPSTQTLSPPPPMSLQLPPPPPPVITSSLNTPGGGNTGSSGKVKLGLPVTLLAFLTLLVNMY